ncbi:MAG: hypothetical protein Q8M08_03130, partial [Bacteroidales bacterium]|nr:hypothetical protein [Bacteroidales bacterium]
VRWNFFSAMPAYQGVHRRYFVTSTKSTYFGGINLSQEVVSVWVGAETVLYQTTQAVKPHPHIGGRIVQIIV